MRAELLVLGLLVLGAFFAGAVALLSLSADPRVAAEEGGMGSKKLVADWLAWLESVVVLGVKPGGDGVRVLSDLESDNARVGVGASESTELKYCLWL